MAYTNKLNFIKSFLQANQHYRIVLEPVQIRTLIYLKHHSLQIHTDKCTIQYLKFFEQQNDVLLLLTAFILNDTSSAVLSLKRFKSP